MENLEVLGSIIVIALYCGVGSLFILILGLIFYAQRDKTWLLLAGIIICFAVFMIIAICFASARHYGGEAIPLTAWFSG